MNSLPWQPIFSIKRSNIVELTVYGLLTVVTIDKDSLALKPLISLGDPKTKLWTRSILKSAQLASNYEQLHSEFTNLKDRHFALMMASHSAQSQHLEILNEIMELTGFSDNDLLCPKVSSKDDNSVVKASFHNCSGKHLSFLLMCKVLNLDVKKYLDPDLPIYDNLKKLLALINPDFLPECTIDGCNIPNYALSASDCAYWYLVLASSGRLAKPNLIAYQGVIKEISRLMQLYPYIIGGNGRLDSSIMNDYNEKSNDVCVVAKEGADGLLAIGVYRSNHDGLGILIKLASGFNKQYMAVIFQEVLNRFNYDKIRDTEIDLLAKHLEREFYF